MAKRKNHSSNSFAFRLLAAKGIIEGFVTNEQVAKLGRVSESTVKYWVRNYKRDGENAFNPTMGHTDEKKVRKLERMIEDARQLEELDSDEGLPNGLAPSTPTDKVHFAFSTGGHTNHRERYLEALSFAANNPGLNLGIALDGSMSLSYPQGHEALVIASPTASGWVVSFEDQAAQRLHNPPHQNEFHRPVGKVVETMVRMKLAYMAYLVDSMREDMVPFDTWLESARSVI